MPLLLALPPTTMPSLPAEIVPELLMPPAKVEIVSDALVIAAADDNAVATRRDRAGIG